MQFRLATAAATMLICAGGAAFAAEEPACSGRAPFREVAQDEIHTFAERCSLESLAGTGRGPTNGNTVGWAKGRGTAPVKKY